MLEILFSTDDNPIKRTFNVVAKRYDMTVVASDGTVSAITFTNNRMFIGGDIRR